MTTHAPCTCLRENYTPRHHRNAHLWITATQELTQPSTARSTLVSMTHTIQIPVLRPKLPATIRNFFAFLTHITVKFSFIIVIPFHSTTHNCCGCNSVTALSKNDYQNQVLCVTYLGQQRPRFETSSLAVHQLCPQRLTTTLGLLDTTISDTEGAEAGGAQTNGRIPSAR